MKKILKRIALIFFGALILAVSRTYLFIRATTPTGISYNPADEGYCEAYGITIDSSQVETVYLHPETILADWKLVMLANELRIAVSGFPGTGKTSLVKALADKYGLPIVEEGMSSIGKAAGGIKRALKQGRKEDLPRLKKCLV